MLSVSASVTFFAIQEFSHLKHTYTNTELTGRHYTHDSHTDTHLLIYKV